MNRRALGMMGAAVALVLVQAVPVAAQSGGFKIGVVNVKDVFSNYELAKSFEKEVEAEKAAAQKEIDDIEKKMKDLMAEIQILEKNSNLRLEKEEELLQLDTLRKFKSERWKAMTLAKINENTAKIYNKIRDEVDEYAAQNQFALILKVETPKLEEASEESANKRVNMRGVLFYDPSMDITKAITERLNAKAVQPPK